MTKYTAKQRKEIDGLVCMLDELPNKPRRLFQALREFADAFLQKDHAVNVISDIDEWEEDYYKNIGRSWIVEKVAQKARSTRKELSKKSFDYLKTESEKMEARSYFKKGVDEATKEMAKSVIAELIDELY